MHGINTAVLMDPSRL